MYRSISELKGFVIDIDTFQESLVTDWEDIVESYTCMFLTTDEKTEQEYVMMYGVDSVYKIPFFIKLFAPSQSLHKTILDIMGLNSTEVAYVSKSKSFLDNAMSFLGGTVWITEEVTYDEAGKAPDLICKGFQAFKKLVHNNVTGFLGEVALFPNTDHIGMIIPITIEVNNASYSMHMLGRYFGYAHYMSQLHPYSSAIYLNKNERGKAFGIFNDIFSSLYICAIKTIKKTCGVDGIVAVPTRPGKVERFAPILERISQECSINNLGNSFKCVTDYPIQKTLSSIERQENIAGVFRYDGDLSGKSIVLIDDIVTTGATIRECISVLESCGATKISVVVLAINQLQGYYWSSHIPQVTCEKCGEKMHLLVNSKNKSYFYSCYDCHNTKSFECGIEELWEQVNDEMK